MITCSETKIFINCEKDFFFEKLSVTLLQKNIIILNQKINYFPMISLSINEKELSLESLLVKKQYLLPFKVDNFIKNLFEIINSFSFDKFGIQYFPYSKAVKDYNSQNKVNLNEIHNIILSNLFLNLDEGISKELLYKYIWPNDKVYSQNKLDTHLTNLKNILSELQNFKKNFKTEKGVLKLN